MANAYGNLADVLDPVKITTQVVGLVYTEEYLRNYCIVSCGDSTLAIGEVQLVTEATYQEYLKATTGKDSELEKALKGYFTTSGQFCFIIETGAFDADTNSIKSQVDVVENYILLHPKKMYMYLAPHSWYYPDERWEVDDTSKPALRISPTTVTLTPEASIALTIRANGTLAYELSEGADAYFTWDAASTTLTALTQNTDKAYTLKVTNTLGDGTSISTNITINVADVAIYDGSYNNNYSLTRDLAFLNLVTSQSDQKFIITGNKLNPETDAGWALYDKKPNIMVVYDNSNTDANGFYLAPAMMGIMGSTKYDLSLTNGNSPLNNKSMAGLAYTELGYTLGEKLVQAPQNFIGDFASNTVLFNGLYADGRSWEFRYANDYMNYVLDLALKRLLYNSANVTSYVLKYNQDGIDVINATIKSQLITLQQMNVITTFAAGYSTITNSMVNETYINCLDFYTYKAAYPENYAAGIYGGVSFYVLICGFIKQINLNITIE